jgi:hypothetical protein
MMDTTLDQSLALDREVAMFIVAVMILILCLFFVGTEMLMAVAAALALIYIVPTDQLRRMLGYLLVVDVLFSFWLVGVAAATLGGFTIAVLAGLTYSVVSRELLAAWGAERIAINGKTQFGQVVAELASQAVAWGKALWTGIKSGKVEAPPSLNFEWVEVKSPGGFAATRTGRIWTYLFG